MKQQIPKYAIRRLIINFSFLLGLTVLVIGGLSWLGVHKLQRYIARPFSDTHANLTYTDQLREAIYQDRFAFNRIFSGNIKDAKIQHNRALNVINKAITTNTLNTVQEEALAAIQSNAAQLDKRFKRLVWRYTRSKRYLTFDEIFANEIEAGRIINQINTIFNSQLAHIRILEKYSLAVSVRAFEPVKKFFGDAYWIIAIIFLLIGIIIILTGVTTYQLFQEVIVKQKSATIVPMPVRQMNTEEARRKEHQLDALPHILENLKEYRTKLNQVIGTLAHSNHILSGSGIRRKNELSHDLKEIQQIYNSISTLHDSIDQTDLKNSTIRSISNDGREEIQHSKKLQDDLMHSADALLSYVSSTALSPDQAAQLPKYIAELKSTMHAVHATNVKVFELVDGVSEATSGMLREIQHSALYLNDVQSKVQYIYNTVKALIESLEKSLQIVNNNTLQLSYLKKLDDYYAGQIYLLQKSLSEITSSKAGIPSNIDTAPIVQNTRYAAH